MCIRDSHGAVSAALLYAVSRGEGVPFLADLTIRHPQNDNAELLWHCGPFPKSLCESGVMPAVVDCKGPVSYTHLEQAMKLMKGSNEDETGNAF